MSASPPRFDRQLLASELAKIIKAIPATPVDEDDWGRYHFEVVFQIREGKVMGRRSAVYLEATDNVEA